MAESSGTLRFSLKSNSAVIVLSFVAFIFLSFGGQSQANSRRCELINNTTGPCISLRNCPSLLKMLSRGSATPETIRELQRLTCGFDKNEPRVCCQADEKKAEENEPENNEEEPTLGHPNIKLLPTAETCGKINVSLGNRIIGGGIPSQGSQPWLARIGYEGGRSNLAFYCGGSLISRRYVLTAAHCVSEGDDAKVTKVRLGEFDTENDPDCSPETGRCSYIQDLSIEKIIAHPNYDPAGKQNDIALIRLAEDVPISEFINPVCLPGKQEYKDEYRKLGAVEVPKPPYAFVAGWGSVKWNVLRPSPVVRYVYLPILTNSKCQDIYTGRAEISEKQLCAGGQAGKDSCDGDSGGPLINYSNSVKSHFQVGIVSYGPTRCGSGGLPGIYTRVTEFMDWILDSIEP